MRIRVLTLKFDSLSGTIDDEPLQEFTRDKEIISVRDHFFIKDNLPCLTLLITYQMLPGQDIEENNDEKKSRRENWRDFIKEEDIPLFNTLREWRIKRSKEEGIPAYLICTNKELGKILEKRPQNLSQLASIEGFGKAKLEKYGQEIIEIFSSVSIPGEAKEAPEIR